MIRLLNGDCIEHMRKLIADGIKVDFILTDVPYGTTACKWDNVIPFDEMLCPFECAGHHGSSVKKVLLVIS